MLYGLKVAECDLRWYCCCPECGLDILIDLMHDASDPVECTMCGEEFFIETNESIDITPYS